MKTGRLSVLVIAASAAVFSAAVAFGSFSLGKYENVKASNGVVSVPVTKLADGKARFYKFTDGRPEIAFFAVKASDGSYKAAFDACDACYKSRKGYEQQGDKMNCKNCNQKFAIGRLGPNATGGCNPGYLPSRVDGGNLVIKADDIKNGAKYF
jgi:uncharacterized membrane protein